MLDWKLHKDTDFCNFHSFKNLSQVSKDTVIGTPIKICEKWINKFNYYANRYVFYKNFSCENSLLNFRVFCPSITTFI